MTCAVTTCLRRACRKPSARGLCVGHALLWLLGASRGLGLADFILEQDERAEERRRAA